MNVKKWLAGAVVTSLLTGGAVLVAAGPASANDEGPDLGGGIYWFNTVGPLSSQSAATQIWSGTGTARPWATLTTERNCPAGTQAIQAYVRIPQASVPENDWDQVALSAASISQDADGRFYTTALPSRPSLAQVLTYNSAHGGQGVFPFVVTCRDPLGNPLGHFRTEITIVGTTTTLTSFSIPYFELPGGGAEAAATTTTLAASAAGADLVLTATLSPAAAAGTVTFKEGATTLGSAAVAGGTAQLTVTAPAQGAHTYTASFAPTDVAAYVASSASIGLVIGIDSTTGQITVTVPAAPVVDGTLTFAVPLFNTPVGLLGTRTGDNSRVTASAAFPRVTVTDTRRDALLTGWEVNVQADDFVGATTIGAKYLGWAPAPPSMTPESGSPLMTQAGSTIASYMDDTASTGLGTSAILGRTTVPGRGVTTLDATLNLAIPGSTPQGDYTSTVTVTLVAD